MPGAVREQQVLIAQDDFSGGVSSRLSARGTAAALKTVKQALNLWFRPKRGLTTRRGSRAISSATLAEKPTSLGKFYASGANKLFAATDDGLGGGSLFRMTTTGKTEQTLGTGFTATNAKWAFEQANACLIGCQRDNAGAPQFYASSNPADTWHNLTLPKPTSAITFTADSGGGALTDTKIYYWRPRYRYTNGSSLAGPVSAANTMNTPNLTANLVIPVPGSPRSDYLGWTLERTDQNGSASGPFYFVAAGTASTYADGMADSSLGYRADETLHGEPPAADGAIFHKGRLFLWRGSAVYVSQLFTDAESTGIANFVGDRIYYLGKDDGDTIQGAVRQGDRLLFGKKNSLYIIEGDDPNSFRVRQIANGIGMGGPRCACSVGPTVFLYAGAGRLFVVRADSVQPWLDTELGDQLEAMDTAYDGDVVAVNWRGEQILFFHRAENATAQEAYLGYDLRFGTPIHGNGMPCIDALAPKDTSDFGGATLLIADPIARNPVFTTAPSLNPSFHCWRDQRGASTQVYVQSLDSLGAARWAADGLQCGNSTGASQVLHSALCGDGAGGIIVAFLDNRSGSRLDVYAQRYNAAGAAQWTAQGVLICNAATVNVGNLGICADGSGGAIIAWCDTRSGGTATRVYAQRINSGGAVQWAANGVQAIASSGILRGSVKCVKGAGATCFIAADTNAGSGGQYLYQLLDASGAAQLGASGAAISGSTQGSGAIQLIADGSDGALLAYTTGASATGDVFVRKLSSAGATSWTANATAGRSSTTGPVLATDGAGGAIVAWRDQTSGEMPRAQRVTSAGALAWVAGGVPLSSGTAASSAFTQSAVADGAGGAIISWTDQSAGAPGAAAQRVDDAGQIQWGATGVRVYTANTNSNLYPNLTTDGNGGCIAIFWHSTTDIRAQRVDAAGSLQWTTSGKPIVTAAGTQDLYRSAFTDTPEAEYPPSATVGYQVWSALEGTRDLRASDGSGGNAIRGSFTTHKRDGGLPRHIKDADLVALTVNRGSGDFSVTVDGDPGSSATVSLQTTATGYRIGIDFLIGTTPLPVTGETTVTSGLPPDTVGRALAITVSGDFTEEVEIGGVEVRALALPWEEY